MTTTMTRTSECSVDGGVLLLAFELSARIWKLGFTVGRGQRPRVRQVPAGAVAAVLAEIAAAKARWGLPPTAPVWSCYEAGREGFWLHRWLVAQGAINVVVDSSSIEVNRRARRAKTDRLDLAGLLTLLERYARGERRVWHVVRVPSVAEEDARHLPRSRETLQQERTRLINRVHGLLATQGVRLPMRADFLERLADARLWDGTPIPPGLTARLQRVWRQLQGVTTALAEVDAARAALSADERARWAARLETSASASGSSDTSRRSGGWGRSAPGV